VFLTFHVDGMALGHRDIFLALPGNSRAYAKAVLTITAIRNIVAI
jgi:hypothetical protein